MELPNDSKFAAIMSLQGLNVNLITKHLLQLINNVTCIECCKYYVLATVAVCGHTACKRCWYGKQICSICAIPITKQDLQLNTELIKKTNNVKMLIEAFEQMFNIKLDELVLEMSTKDETGDNVNKNVKDWLTNSQNNFSAPISSQSTQDLNPHHKYLTSEIQVHTSSVKTHNLSKVIVVTNPQDDYDKIEPMTENLQCLLKEQKNTKFTESKPFTNNINTQKSDKDKQANSDTKSSVSHDIPSDNINATISVIKDKPYNNIKQTVNRGKKIKKGLSKVNRERKKKLNVSLEMCKTGQISDTFTQLPNKEKLSCDMIDDSNPENICSQKVNEQNHLFQKNKISPNTIKDVNQDPEFSNKNVHHLKETAKYNYSKEKTLSSINKSDTPIVTENNCGKSTAKKPSKVLFFRKSSLINVAEKNPLMFDNKCYNETGTDDIGISIRFGKTVTNICIKNKENEVQLKIQSDKETQTSSRNENIFNNVNNINRNLGDLQKNIPKEPISDNKSASVQFINRTQQKHALVKSSSTNKNTDSAETGTVKSQITGSTEKRLFDITEAVENETVQKTDKCEIPDRVENLLNSSQKENVSEDIENDLDIFEFESQKTSSVQLLKSTKKLTSAVLVPIQNNFQKRKQLDKSSVHCNSDENLPSMKKRKICQKNNNEFKITNDNVNKKDRCARAFNNSECDNYDLVMHKVFADTIQKDYLTSIDGRGNSKNLHKVIPNQIESLTSQEILKKPESENLFSVHEVLKSPRATIESSPSCRDLVLLQEGINKEIRDVEVVVLSTPLDENSDSDKSVVEETPQKKVSFQKGKLNQSTSFKSDFENHNQLKLLSINKENVASTVNLYDSEKYSTKRTKESIDLHANKMNKSVESPANLKMFVDEIKLKSTPLARKSLKFNSVNNEPDPEQTLCPSMFAMAATTQEKEFMNEVFEQRSLTSANILSTPVQNNIVQVKNCVAGSCLTASELAELKVFCEQRGWSFVNKYTENLTHLVVAVDEDNKSQRSIKYIRALAAGKWIVSYAWVEKCMQTKTVVKEESYECLDMTGEPGPRRSRLAKRKLFEGITFYCMQPFSLLEVDIIKEILEAAGGHVVKEFKEIRLVNEKPALLLAEPEHTQEDRFIYLAMEHKIVPVNCEWAINCLGSYTLDSIMELLLCPSSLLPPVISKWPASLIAQDID